MGSQENSEVLSGVGAMNALMPAHDCTRTPLVAGAGVAREGTELFNPQAFGG